VTYEYHAKLVRVIDGDTVVLDVDLGFHATMRETFRLYGVNCPEMHGATKEAGQAAKAFVEKWFASHPEFVTESFKGRTQDKYGRWLAVIHPTPDRSDDALNEALLTSGHAVEFTG